ncbi:MAG TPA: PQQ-binding-like beta-propeller repeat protein [Candidatus Lokiarchaeia archaeon]|nr:PQQ-binding-like beta-propeller repeat protein [Candidatus Lokiarchaeia archaeon]
MKIQKKAIVLLGLTALLCLGIQFDLTNPRRNLPTMEGGKIRPQSSASVAFLYVKDLVGATSFQSLLNANGFITDLVKVSTITSSTLSRYSLIIIGPDTGTWTNATLVTWINGSISKILAMGEGGYRFMGTGAAGLTIGSPNGNHGTSQNTNFTAYFAANFNAPYAIPAGSTVIFTSAVDYATISVSYVPASDHVLSKSLAGGYDDIIQQANRYLYWGFNGSANLFTTAGSRAFLDVVQNLQMPSSDQFGDDWPMIQGALNHTGVVKTTPVKGVNATWAYQTYRPIFSCPAIVGGRVYFGDDDHSVYCLDAITGNQVWNYSTTYSVVSSPAVANDRVYIGCYDGNLYCLNATTGKSLWNYTTTGDIDSSPAVWNGRLYFGSWDFNLYCLNASNGMLKWKNNTGDSIDTSPAIVNGRVYVGNQNGREFCFNATTGNWLWTYIANGRISSSAAISGSRLFVGTWGNKTYCLNATTGKYLWAYNATNEFYASPAVSGVYVYIGCCDHHVYCLSATTGTQIWNFTTGDQVLDNPSIAGGCVYIGSEDHNEYCLNATTGALIWYFDTGAWMECSAGIAGGHVYVGGISGYLFCLPMIVIPSVPLNLQAMPGNTQVTLSWSPPSSNIYSAITGYKIYKGTTSGGETLLTTVGNVLTYNVTGLTNGQIYYFKVAAVNGQGTGATSTEASTTAGLPGIPRNLLATRSVKQIALTWDPPASNGGSPITNYVIFQSTLSGYEALRAITGNVTLYVDSSLANNQVYYYFISAENAIGQGLQTSEVSAVTASTPGAPVNLQATIENGQVQLSWVTPASDGGTPITGYSIYCGNSSGNEELLTTVGVVLNYTATGLTNGQVYYFKVAAVNFAGTSANSTEASATPATVPGVPRTVAASGGSAQVTLTWAAPASNGGSNITGYKIYRGTTSGAEVYLTTVGNVLTYTDKGVTNGQMYYYEISAVNGQGEGLKSNETSAKPASSGSTGPGIPGYSTEITLGAITISMISLLVHRRKKFQR